MGSWQPLQFRQAGETEGLYEGVPDHLSALLWQWVRRQVVVARGGYHSDRMRLLAMLARMPLTTSENSVSVYRSFEGGCTENTGYLLAVVDAALGRLVDNKREPQFIDSLRQVLELGNSAWTVSPDNSALSRRVDPTAELAAAEAMRPDDAATNELREAWGKAYGLDADASDAWDHAIKAVEHVYRDRISPSNERATLGTLIRDLDNGKHLFQFKLDRSESAHVDSVVRMMKMMWPNPDRHGGGEGVEVSLEAARAVVHLAITLVQWGRSGALVKQP